MEEVAALAATFGAIAVLMGELNMLIMLMTYKYLGMRRLRKRRNLIGHRYSMRHKVTRQLDHLHYIVSFSDETCRDHLRMTRDCFNRLCFLLENVGGLSPTRHVTISEQVAVFLTVLSHHTKNRIIKASFKRSGYTVSKYFNCVLNTLLKLYTILLVTPEPVADDDTDSRWKYFKVIENY